VLEVVDPRWLLKALGLTVLGAAICAYLALCLLLYQGGWQLMLHPKGTASHAADHLPKQALRFDAAATGSPRLSGWWIPAATSDAKTRTILYLHDGDTTLEGLPPAFPALYLTGANLFTFDYRGYGASDGPHPSEARMLEDAGAALDYLVNTRHIPAGRIVPYGVGLGAVLAARLVQMHPELPVMILESPDPQAFTRATSSGRAQLLPMRSLLQEKFDLGAALTGSSKPKLLFTDSPFGSTASRREESLAAFRSAPDPKMIVTFDDPHAGDAYLRSIQRFLDEYDPR
jgi:alpha-beta hydrolase superfamily lysophospholipase